MSIFELNEECQKLYLEARDRQWYSGNIEYGFLENIWNENIKDGLIAFISKYFRKKKQEASSNWLVYGLYRNPYELQKQLNLYEDSQQLIEFLIFHVTTEKTIFSITPGDEFPEDYNIFEFPSFLSIEQINDYLLIIRNACFEYGLRIRRISEREFVTYWDKTFNRNATDELEVFRIDYDPLRMEAEEFQSSIKRIMR